MQDKDDGFVINLHKREGKSYDDELYVSCSISVDFVES